MPRSIEEPIWSSDDPGPRVLVEVTDFTKRDAIARILDRHGFSVRTCGGPEEFDERCPLAEGGTCAGVGDADVVVNSMPLSSSRNREVVDGIRDRYPDTPLVMEAPAPLVAERPEDYEGIRVIPQPLTSATLLEAIEEALAS